MPATNALGLYGAPFSEWSEPVSVGPPINVPGVIETGAFISRDELSLFFESDRTDVGTLGARDIYVSRRDCVTCPWQTPMNLGAAINTPYVDGSPSLSDDGHFLFFISHKPTEDCQIDPGNPPPDPIRPCLEDIYVSSRSDPNDDLGWSAPTRLGPPLNTSGPENTPQLQPNAGGGADLYFTRSRVAGLLATKDIFRVEIRLHGVGSGGAPHVEIVGPVESVDELNAFNIADLGLTIRTDGKEVYFFSTVQRGGLGALDIWRSTRQNTQSPWSEPVNAGAPLNTRFADQAPNLSHDGRTMYFTSARQGPPNMDIWVTRRTIGVSVRRSAARE
jgi:hypothetical protein